MLYPHYATLVRPWGIAALEDQRLAAGIMWIAGDAIFLTAILAVVAGWMRAEARGEARADRQAPRSSPDPVRERRLADAWPRNARVEASERRAVGPGVGRSHRAGSTPMASTRWP